MTPPSRLLVSSVVRGSRQGDSHGGLYLVDIERESFEQVLDWNTSNINFEGRGADRGLRGIAIRDDRIFIAASDELFVFNRRFEIVASYRNAYLKHCHEIFASDRHLYLTSTGFDSVLRFDLASGKFDQGICLQRTVGGLAATIFDPCAANGPPPNFSFHLNSVYVDQGAVYVSGRELSALVCFGPHGPSVIRKLPLGTHNARPFAGGVLFNDTQADCIRWLGGVRDVSMPVPRYDEAELRCVDVDASGIARQAFGRGLCPITDTLIAAGSSPTTVSIYNVTEGRRLKSINVTMDVRNAAHGMAIWPY